MSQNASIPIPEEYRSEFLSPGEADRISQLILVSDNLVGVTDEVPAKLIKINKTNFDTRSAITFAADGKHNNAVDVCYASSNVGASKDRCYVIFGSDTRLVIAEVNLNNMTTTDIYDQPTASLLSPRAIATDGNYVSIILANEGGVSKFVRLELASYAEDGIADMGGYLYCNDIAATQLTFWTVGQTLIGGGSGGTRKYLVKISNLLALSAVEFPAIPLPSPPPIIPEPIPGLLIAPHIVPINTDIYVAFGDKSGYIWKFAQAGPSFTETIAHNLSGEHHSLEYDGQFLWQLMSLGFNYRAVRLNLADHDIRYYQLSTTVDGTVASIPQMTGDPPYIYTSRLESSVTRVERYRIPGNVNENGAWVWDVVIPKSTAIDSIQAVDVHRASGDVAVLGNVSGNGVYAAKYGSDKTLRWERSFSSLGNARAVAVDSSGHLIIIGDYLGSANFSCGALDGFLSANSIYVVKVNGNTGACMWSKGFKGSFQSSNEGYGVAVDSSDNVWFCGFMTTADFGNGQLTSNGPFITKLSGVDGSYLFAAPFAGTGRARAITVDASNNVFITGDHSSAINFGGTVLTPITNTQGVFVASFNSAGVHRWSHSYSGMGFNFENSLSGHTIKTLPAALGGDVIVGGGFSLNINFGGGIMTKTPQESPDGFLARLTNAAGNYVWQRQIRGNYVTVNDITIDPNPGTTDDNTNVIIGAYGSQGKFGNDNTVTNGEAAIAKYSAGNAFRWAKAFPTGNGVRGIGSDSANNIYAGGPYRGTVNFGGGSRTSAGANDLFLVKLGP